ncbi:hypothetical protein FACS189440_21910 [Bacteroidia bacterium]|nr:hypothetical protein FACS189440_21910 [Bacteroidia bacterium]
MQNDFKPFEKIMTKIGKKKLDSSYELYLSLYHQLSGEDDEEAFRQFKPDFFDLIVIDEYHRGSAREESRWHKILDYFQNATHIGMTATPKETKDISSSHYFGEPIYTYSLKEGIADGFLAPYKVVRIGLDKDLQGYRPEVGKLDANGEEIEDREYNIKDFDRTLVLDDRTKKVAQTITKFLKNTDRFSKTIVFCVDIEHAERMRQALVNENDDLVAQNPKYIMRITGDNEIGKAQLDNFIDEDCSYPTIVTTSKLMTTGVDCKTCKLIVLENNINSMTEFKQIIGRGTRLKPDYGKYYFTIMDFRGVSRLFADKDFDGDPVQIYEPEEDESPVPPEIDTQDNPYPEIEEKPDITADPPVEYNKRKKYWVKDVEILVLSEQVQYYDMDGKLITESLKDYSRKNIRSEFATLDDFLKSWNGELKEKAIVEELKEKGVLLEALREIADKPDIDDFDLILHIAYDRKPLTRKERANNVKKKGYLYKYSGLAQDVLNTLLEKYATDGSREFDDTKILSLREFSQYGSPLKIVKLFGGKDKFIEVAKELKTLLYTA